MALVEIMLDFDTEYQDGIDTAADGTFFIKMLVKAKESVFPEDGADLRQMHREIVGKLLEKDEFRRELSGT